MKFSKPVSKDFTNASQIALQAQSNAMFYVGDTAPVAPKTGMVWVKINQANDNWLAHGKTSNTLRSGVVAKGSWSYTVAYGTDWLVSKGSIMTASIWLDLTGENISDLGLNLMSHQSNNQWWASGNQNVTLPDGTVTPTTVPMKAGQKGWVTLTFQFPADTNLNQLELYVSRLVADGVATQDIPIQYSSPKIDWDTKRTEWCDGTNYDKGNIEGAQKWDGNKWVPTAFTSDVIADYIYGKNIIGSTFANADGSFKVDSSGNITGANITGSEFVTSMGAHSKDPNVWNDWSWTGGQTTIGSGFINSHSTGLISGDNVTYSDVWNTITSAYIKLVAYTQPDANHEVDRAYLEAFGLSLGIGTQMYAQFWKNGIKIHRGSSETNIDEDTVQTHLGNFSNVQIGNIYSNGAHSWYSQDGKDMWFRPNGDSGGVALNATAFNKISQLSTKTNVREVDDNAALTALNGLQIVKYNRKNKLGIGENHDQYGGIIDDVNSTAKYQFPKEFLSADGQSEDDSNLLAFAVKSIQKLTKLNENLQLRLAGLEIKNGTNSNFTN